MFDDQPGQLDPRPDLELAEHLAEVEADGVGDRYTWAATWRFVFPSATSSAILRSVAVRLAHPKRGRSPVPNGPPREPARANGCAASRRKVAPMSRSPSRHGSRLLTTTRVPLARPISVGRAWRPAGPESHSHSTWWSAGWSIPVATALARTVCALTETTAPLLRRRARMKSSRSIRSAAPVPSSRRCSISPAARAAILAIAETGHQLDAVEAGSDTHVGHPPFEDVASGVGEDESDVGAGEVPGDALDHRTRSRHQATVGVHVRVIACLEAVGSDPCPGRPEPGDHDLFPHGDRRVLEQPSRIELHGSSQSGRWTGNKTQVRLDREGQGRNKPTAGRRPPHGPFLGMGATSVLSTGRIRRGWRARRPPGAACGAAGDGPRLRARGRPAHGRRPRR